MNTNYLNETKYKNEAELADNENLIISLRKEIEEKHKNFEEIFNELKSYKNDNKKLFEENKILGINLYKKKTNEKELKFFEEILMKIILYHPNFEIKNIVISLIDLFDYTNNLEYDKIKLEKKLENLEKEFHIISNDSNFNSRNIELENSLINQIKNMKDLVVDFEIKINNKKNEMINLYNILENFNSKINSNFNNNSNSISHDINNKKAFLNSNDYSKDNFNFGNNKINNNNFDLRNLQRNFSSINYGNGNGNESFNSINNNSNNSNNYDKENFKNNNNLAFSNEFYLRNNINNNVNNNNNYEEKESTQKYCEDNINNNSYRIFNKTSNSKNLQISNKDSNYNNSNSKNEFINSDSSRQGQGSIFTFNQSEKRIDNDIYINNNNDNELFNLNYNYESGKSYLNEIHFQKKNMSNFNFNQKKK
jgi:hypothetical protein